MPLALKLGGSCNSETREDCSLLGVVVESFEVLNYFIRQWRKRPTCCVGYSRFMAVSRAYSFSRSQRSALT